jgi:pantoate kinase
MKRVIVRVPHRISGFFEIVDEINGIKINNPEKIGSRGAGFNLNSFGTTEIQLEETDGFRESRYKIYINDNELNEKAETSNYILERYLQNLGSSYHIKIFHNFDLPVGCGFGASGSGALGCIYGLNDLLNLNLSHYEKGRIAHIAEVVNRTGLGTVCGQLGGGLSILLEPGFPCSCQKIKISEEVIVICGSFGEIPTKSILTDPQLNKNIKTAGKKALSCLLNTPSLNNFIKFSYQFVKDSKILSILNLHEIEQLLKELNRLDIIGASMNQLGRSVFIFCDKRSEKEVQEVLTSYSPDLKIFKSSINENRTFYKKIKL